MKNINLIFFVLVIFIITECKDNSVTPPPPTEYEPLIPLSVGNYWLYRSYELNSDGSGGLPNKWKFGFIILPLPIQPATILDTVNYNMSMCAEDLSPLDDSKYLQYGGSKSVYQNKNGFYYSGIIRNDTLVRIYNDLIFPYPVKKGVSVKGHVFYYNNAGNTSNVPDEVITDYVCVSTDSLFTTPLGDFRCIVYKMAWADFEPLYRAEVYYFIKPGIGIVGMINMAFHYGSNEYTYIRKILLTDYKIK